MKKIIVSVLTIAFVFSGFLTLKIFAMNELKNILPVSQKLLSL